MNWLNSIFISFLTGLLGLLSGGLIMGLCVDWYRISSFEGKAGIFVVTVATLGGVAGFVVGLVVTRLVAQGADPSFLKGLGSASGTVMAIALLTLAICRLSADLDPTMDGRPLELEIEIRCPHEFILPTKLDEYGATAGVYIPQGRRLPVADLQLADASNIDGHWVVTAMIPLTTRSSDKFLNVRFNEDTDLLFHLPLRSNPKKSDLEWSTWVESGWDVDKPEPAEETKFKARYRVQIIEPEPPEPDPATMETERFEALDPNEPLENWLEFLSYDGSKEQNMAVAEVVAGRQGDLATLIGSSDEAVREKALLATQYLGSPTPEVSEAVLAEGRTIAEGIRESNSMKDTDPEFYQKLNDLRSRFNSWKQSWWVIHQRLGLDGRPPVQEIHELARIRERGTAMDDIELDARVILESLNK